MSTTTSNKQNHANAPFHMVPPTGRIESLSSTVGAATALMSTVLTKSIYNKLEKILLAADI